MISIFDADPAGRGKIGDHINPFIHQGGWKGREMRVNSLKTLEAATGFEPVNNGFADRCLTPWLCRLWSGKRDSNPRLQPWQGCTLPLSYSRSAIFFVKISPLVKGKIGFSVFGLRFPAIKSLKSRSLVFQQVGCKLMVLVAPGCCRGCSGGTPKLAKHCGTGA